MRTANPQRLLKPRFLLPAILCLIALLSGARAWAADYFNPALLDIDTPGQSKTDLSVYENGPGQAPGKYRVTLFINNKRTDSLQVDFKLVASGDGHSSLQPCFSVDRLKQLGVLTEKFPALARGGRCASLQAIPNATATFRVSEQQLLLSIPQSALGQIPRGYIPPEEFDEGINAGLLNYSVSVSRSHALQAGIAQSSSQYVNLRPGLNIGAWRLRNYSTWSRTTSGNSSQSDFSSVYTYARRDIITLKSQLTLGQSSTPADVFDSVPYTGAAMASDDDMLPDSEKGYAPVVRGIAHSNAQVVVRQNGYIIYQNTVAPGAFEINDLYPTGGSGDLNVTVKETDGSEQHFVVPYASVPVLQREGHLKYQIAAGRYRAYDDSVEQAPFMQSSVIYGLSRGFTAYGGFQQSQHYQSQALGVGKNFGGLGAFSVDVTRARALLKNRRSSRGNAWRARYSKDIATTGTNLSLAGYRYNSQGFYTLGDTLDSWTHSNDASAPPQRRSRSEATIDQTLGDKWGTLTLSLVKERYWDGSPPMTSVAFSYNNSWHNISYSVNYSVNKNTAEDNDSSGDDRVLALNVSIPLDQWMPKTWASYSLNNGKSGTTQNIGLSGTALRDNNLNWSVQQGISHSGAGNTTNLNADYKGTYGEVNAGYSRDGYQRSINYGLQGGVVVHAHGVTLSQPLGETIALVQAPGTHGTHIANQTGVATDFRGYTVVPYVSAWRHTTIALDTETLPDDVDVTQADQIVTPTRGAVVRARFHPRIGNRVLIRLTRNGTPLPFGATVTTDDRDSEFIIGDDGQAYITGLSPHGHLTANWGTDSRSRCTAEYSLPSTVRNQIINLSALCR
ncbi:fimbria/pilus outer membrane usher protein [[Enterobacter] lignolyticus]|uniref:fimbria/pilus outer membrane usher protein n=1 Tax=[Enterobacter] lignolyticus TaxID=1334193 RepID=UPI0009832599|nr:fimbria/pilus outer membrane usher protein [[Enterobacter] lignolyticus]